MENQMQSPKFISHRKSKKLLNDLVVANLSLNNFDKLIYDARIDSSGLFEFGNDDFVDTINDLVMRIHVISGSNLPSTDFLVELLESELSKALNDFKFTNLSINEILLAFRLNCVADCYVEVEVDYVPLIGGCLNVDYILRVLYNYRKHRHSFERKIQNKLDGYNS